MSSHRCRRLFHCGERPRETRRLETQETLPQDSRLQAADLQFLSIAERGDVGAAWHDAHFRNEIDIEPDRQDRGQAS